MIKEIYINKLINIYIINIYNIYNIIYQLLKIIVMLSINRRFDRFYIWNKYKIFYDNFIYFLKLRMK